jgi:hypothetical protein
VVTTTTAGVAIGAGAGASSAAAVEERADRTARTMVVTDFIG